MTTCYLEGFPDRNGKYIKCAPITPKMDYCHGCRKFICEKHDGPPDQHPIGPHQPLDHVFVRHISEASDDPLSGH